MTNNNSKHVILWHVSIQQQAEQQENPWEIWRIEDKEAKEGQSDRWVSTGPDVYQREGQWRAQEGHLDNGRREEL